MRLPIIRPDIEFDAVADSIRDIIESGILTSGPTVAAFEAAVAEAVGVRHAVSTTSATTALHLALAALGVGPGDEVLVSDFTFPASGNVIAQLGATPVLVDCAPGSFVLDPDDAASKVTSSTRAIMPVHPFGQPADLTAIGALADAHDLDVVEDAACALGSSLDGINCGSRFVGCFSFHPRKVVTTGEGGAVTTDDEELAVRLRLLRNHGGEPSEVGLRFVDHGFNYRMGEVPAAIGLVQLARLDEILADRRRSALRYYELLSGIDGVDAPREPLGHRWSYQSFVVVLDDDVDRNAVVSALRARGIESTLGTYAMHAHPAFARYGYCAGDLPNSYRAESQSLTLPLVPGMTEDQLVTVATLLADAIDTR